MTEIAGRVDQRGGQGSLSFRRKGLTGAVWVSDVKVAVSKAIRRGAKHQKGRDEENHQAFSKAELLQGIARAGRKRSRHSIDPRIGLVWWWLESVGVVSLVGGCRSDGQARIERAWGKFAHCSRDALLPASRPASQASQARRVDRPVTTVTGCPGGQVKAFGQPPAPRALLATVPCTVPQRTRTDGGFS